MEKGIVGGQAVIEGVLMKNKEKIAIAVRKPDRKISVKKDTFESVTSKFKILKLPILRGAVAFIEMMVFGIKALSFSANEAYAETEEEKLTTKEIVITMGFSFTLAIGLFFLLPLFITKSVSENQGVLFNLLDNVIRLSFVLAYMIGISFMKDVRRLFEYHGAEHKTINCYEAGQKLTIRNVKKHTRLNARCGTSFIFYVILISTIVFSLFQTENIAILAGIRIIFLPIIAGIAYEVLKFAAKHECNPVFKFLIYPGLMLQKITTREPNDKQLEVAIESLKAVVALDE